MTDPGNPVLERFLDEMRRDYARKFPRSRERLDSHGRKLLDHSSHAIRWNDPFMPLVRRTGGAWVEDLDGHRILDYWQGHFANLLGHNPALVRDSLIEVLADGRGLQSGMLHEIEWDVADLICRCTGAETARMTTSGTLGTLYATVLARAYTRRDRVLKVSGGWHGSQPFGLKGVSPRGGSFDHLESEGLSAGADGEVELTRFNDTAGLRDLFHAQGDRIACFVLEPVLGAGGGMAATAEYLQEARRLTERHGALLLCDEIITGFRFRAGDLASAYGVRPDLWILGKVLGGGMPVAAVAGREDVLDLGTRRSGRVKFEGGTYSAHELSLVAARTVMRHLMENEAEIYGRLAERGKRMREEVARAGEQAGLTIRAVGEPAIPGVGSSLVFAHVMKDGAAAPASPDELAARGHPWIGERVMKATMLLEDLSTRSGIGAISTSHTDGDLLRTVECFRAGLERFKNGRLV